ncbi:hypothetical protein EBR21_02575 [bacterium]|nr:hypothetical protein [bacterium]
MAYKHSKLDEVAFHRHFEEAVSMAMRHVGVNYSEALELIFTPLHQAGGVSVADHMRRGHISLAKRALAELIDDRRRFVASGAGNRVRDES